MKAQVVYIPARSVEVSFPVWPTPNDTMLATQVTRLITDSLFFF